MVCHPGDCRPSIALLYGGMIKHGDVHGELFSPIPDVHYLCPNIERKDSVVRGCNGV